MCFGQVESRTGTPLNQGSEKNGDLGESEAAGSSWGTGSPLWVADPEMNTRSAGRESSDMVRLSGSQALLRETRRQPASSNV